jgi:hypothetical protein
MQPLAPHSHGQQELGVREVAETAATGVVMVPRTAFLGIEAVE